MEQHLVLGVEQYKPGKYQPRQSFDKAKLTSLAQRMQQTEYIQPLLVCLDKSDGMYEIIGGERRWRAAQIAQISQLPAIVKDDLSDQQKMLLSLVDNTERENLNVIEEARAFLKLNKEGGLIHSEIAEYTGRGRAEITNLLRLLKLPEPVQLMLAEGLLKPGHGKALLMLKRKVDQLSIAGKSVQNQWSVRKLEDFCQDINKKLLETQVVAVRKDPNLVALENAFSDYIGNQVRVNFDTNSGKGSMEIRFNSLDECEGILEKCGFRMG